MDITPDFKEFIQLLNQNNVHYLVVGGYAVAAYGYPRYTGDIDFWIKPDNKNAENIVNALLQFGFGSVDINKEDFLKENFVVQLGYPPNRIDIMTGISGLAFEECWEEKKEIDLEGEKIFFISLRHLKLNKAHTGRDKDKLDLNNLP
jgi:hypothetical protein